ncbi:hypothetical protein FRB96_008689 [Tulasnella sp. 330]|nr:hypothetical protein FRB96_008689 [Tulasnella sp. 330]
MVSSVPRITRYWYSDHTTPLYADQIVSFYKPKFLKGAYFDGFLELLAQWPSQSDSEGSGGLRSLSIIQEPPPRHLNSLATHTSFAQPMVFFSFKPISILARSLSVGKSIRQLRLRIPSRLYSRELSVISAFPGLTFLDVSTSVMGESELKELLVVFRGLQHLVVDATGLCGYGGVRNGWRDVGRMCASSGIERARAKERSVNQQILRRRQQEQAEGITDVLPTANVSVIHQKTTSRSSRPRAFGSSNISIRDASGASNDQRLSFGLSSSLTSTPAPTPTRTGIRILPPPPTLRTLCAATGPDEPQPTSESQTEWIEEFEEGWKEGIDRLKEHWNRLTIFTRNASTIDLVIYNDDHVTTMDPTDASPATLVEDVDGIVMAGLVDAEGSRFQDALGVDWERPPVICFGSESSLQQQCYSEGTSFGTFIAHRAGCGHVVGHEL